MKYKITDLMDLYEDPNCPFPPLDKPLQKKKSNHKEICEVKQSKHRFDWKQGLSIAAALGVMALGVSGILLLKNRSSQPGSAVGAAPPNNVVMSSTPTESYVAETLEATIPQETNAALSVDLSTLVEDAFLQSGEDALAGTPDAANPVPSAYSYEIPCLLADTDGARAINAAIEEKWGAYARAQCERIRQKLPCQTTDIHWNASYTDGILALKLDTKMCRRLSPELPSEPILDVYFYDVADGRRLTSAEMLERKGITEEAWLKACRDLNLEESFQYSPLSSEDPQLIDGEYVYQVQIDSAVYEIPTVFYPYLEPSAVVPFKNDVVLQIYSPAIFDEAFFEGRKAEESEDTLDDVYELLGQPPYVVYLDCVVHDLSTN